MPCIRVIDWLLLFISQTVPPTEWFLGRCTKRINIQQSLVQLPAGVFTKPLHFCSSLQRWANEGNHSGTSCYHSVHSTEQANAERKKRWCEGGMASQLLLWLGPGSLWGRVEEYRFAKEKAASPWSFLRGADFSLWNTPAEIVDLSEVFPGVTGIRFYQRVCFQRLVPVPYQLCTIWGFPQHKIVRDPCEWKQAVGSEMWNNTFLSYLHWQSSLFIRG